jgi:hypothetical protein
MKIETITNAYLWPSMEAHIQALNVYTQQQVKKWQ